MKRHIPPLPHPRFTGVPVWRDLHPEAPHFTGVPVWHGPGSKLHIVRVPGWLNTWLSPAHTAAFLEHASPYLATVILTAVTAFTSIRTLLSQWRNARHIRGGYLIEVAVPAEVDPASAARFWSRLAGLISPWWKRTLFGQAHLTFEYVADERGIRFQIWVPGSIPPGLIDKVVGAAWPGATVTTHPTGPPIPLHATSAGGRMVLGRAEHYPLATSHDLDPIRDLLTALDGLEPGEHAAVQIVARPVTGRRLRHAYRAAATLRGGRSTAPQAAFFNLVTPGMSGHSHPSELSRMFPERDEEVRRILAKASGARFEVEIRYACATSRSSGPRAESWTRGLAHEIASTFALYTSGQQHLRRARLRRPAHTLARRHMTRGPLLSADELAALAHLPLEPSAPGVTRAGARPASPTPVIPSKPSNDVRILGDSQARRPRPICLPIASGRHHIHVIGQIGSGKSTFLANLVLSDAYAGRGAIVIDPKGDLVTDVLKRLPERAIGRTVVFDPAEEGPPPCVNVLAGPDKAFAVDAIVTIFQRCFSSAWGPRMEDLMRAACLSLVSAHGNKATLADLPRLLTDPDYRLITAAKVSDPLLREFWESYDAMSPATRASLVGPIMNKLRAVLLRPFIRDALSGATSTVDIGYALDHGGLILIRLPKGVLGEDAARLFGSLMVAHTWQAVLARSRQPEDERRDAALYADEVQNFLNLPGSVSDILNEARGYRLGFVLAHQHLSQLPRDLRDAVSADARNKVYFVLSPEDAGDLARHVDPQLTKHDLANLGTYQAAGRILAGAQKTPAFTFKTRPLPDVIEGREEAVRAASRDRYTRPEPKETASTTALPETDTRYHLGEPS